MNRGGERGTRPITPALVFKARCMQARPGWKTEGLRERPPATRTLGWADEAVLTAFFGAPGKCAGGVGVLLVPSPLGGSEAEVDNNGLEDGT